MKILSLVFMLLQFHLLTAQINDNQFAHLNDTIIAKYNRADFKSIYSLGSDNFKMMQGPEDFVNQLSNFFKETGKIKGTELNTKYPTGRSFKWTGEKKNLRFDFISATGKDISEYNLNDFIEQPNSASKKILTDNHLTNNIDSIVQKNALIYMSDTNSVGLSIGILKDSKTYTYNYGEIKKGTRLLPKSTTFYELGSITKTFVGMLLAKAVVERKVKLTDDIRRYLKGDYPNLEYNGHPIQLVNLANHTSGLPNWTINRPDSLDNLQPFNQHLFYEKYTLNDLLRDLHNIKLDTVPGIRFNYSAAGINTLIIILQNIYSKPFEQLTREYFGARFGMRDTKKTLTKSEINRFVTGYDERRYAVPFFLQNTAALGPGLVSTVQDMLKYISYNLQEKSEAVKLSHQHIYTLVNDYALALCWMLNKNWQGDNYVFHNGSGWGCISACTIYPTKSTGFIIFVNEKVSQERVGALERNLSSALNEE